MNGQGKLFAAKRTTSADPAGAILSEASRDYDLLMLGAAPQHVAESSMTGRILKDAKLPAVVVRAGDGSLPAIFCRLLVPLDGSVFSHAAAEFAFAYAGAARAHVTLLHVVNEARVTIGTVALPESHESHPAAAIERSALERGIRAEYDPLAADGNTSYEVRVLVSGDPGGTIVEVAGTGEFDLLVLGAENKLIAQPLFFGQGTASIVDRVECTAAVVVPWVR
jgi:K+:H+ antiporter